MGYISIQINKAKCSADTGASDHIERKTIPKNADPTRTHLNRELVEFPDGVSDRTEAISRTFGNENTVSAVLHMDEHTPHIHATVIPIVTGERRKAKKKQEDGKRSYRKKANIVRLCADVY